MFKKIFHFLFDCFEEKILRKTTEYRRSTYGSFWSYFKKYGVFIGDVVSIGGEHWVVVGMSKGPGFYSGERTVPIQFRKKVNSVMEAVITFFDAASLGSKKLEVVQHYPIQKFVQ